MSDIRYNGWLHRSGTGGVWQDSSGRVGIGSSAPTKLLELKGTDPTIKLWDSSGDAYALIEGDFADQGSIRFRADPTSAGGSSHIRFDIDGNEKFRIGTGGGGSSIGISTDVNMVTNSEVLCVRGYSSFKSGSQAYAALYIGNEGNTTDTANALILFNQGGSNRSGIGYVPNTGEFRINNQYYMTFCTGGTSLAGAERLRIRTDGRVSIASSLAVTGICTAATFVPTEGQLSNRNYVINGDMALWQRGTTSINMSQNKYLVDRFKAMSSSDGQGAVSQHSNVPTQVQTGGTQFPWSLRVNCTTADSSLASGQYAIITQRIEGRNIRPLGFGLAGTRYATLSFWQRSPSGTYHVAFRNSAYNRYYLVAYTAASNTWEKHVMTIPIDTSGTWLSTTGTGLDIQWSLGTGDADGTVGSWSSGNKHAGTGQKNFYDTVGNDFYLTGVQFEAGSAATPYETLKYGDQLHQCMRYFQIIHNVQLTGAKNTSTRMRLNCNSFVVPMRETPSYTRTSNNLSFQLAATNTQSSDTTEAQGGFAAVSNGDSYGRQWDFGGFTNLADRSYVGNQATAVFHMDAEL